MNIKAGASGGPVAFGTGEICGINSTRINGHDDISFISSISDLINIPIPNVSFAERRNQEYHRPTRTSRSWFSRRALGNPQ